jgi:hypothetical protein
MKQLLRDFSSLYLFLFLSLSFCIWILGGNFYCIAEFVPIAIICFFLACNLILANIRTIDLQQIVETLLPHLICLWIIPVFYVLDWHEPWWIFWPYPSVLVVMCTTIFHSCHLLVFVKSRE